MVPPPGGDADRAGDAGDSNRCGPARGGAVAELPELVLPPAGDRAVAKERTGVPPPGANVDGTGQSRHLHRRGRRGGRPVAELPEIVFAPAPHRAVAEHRAGVGAAAADGDGSSDAAHCDWCRRTGVGTVTELSLVASPAPQRAVPQQRTGVIGPGREGVAPVMPSRPVGVPESPWSRSELAFALLAHTASCRRRAHRWPYPVARATAPLRPFTYGSLSGMSKVRRALPRRTQPQHRAVPSKGAHPYSSPAATRVAVVMPVTGSERRSCRGPIAVHELVPPVHCAVPSGRRTGVFAARSNPGRCDGPLAVNCCVCPAGWWDLRGDARRRRSGWHPPGRAKERQARRPMRRSCSRFHRDLHGIGRYECGDKETSRGMNAWRSRSSK